MGARRLPDAVDCAVIHGTVRKVCRSQLQKTDESPAGAFCGQRYTRYRVAPARYEGVAEARGCGVWRRSSRAALRHPPAYDAYGRLHRVRRTRSTTQGEILVQALELIFLAEQDQAAF